MKPKQFPVLPPEKLDRELLLRFPRLDEDVAEFRVNPPMPWPEWCYLPMAASYAIVSDGDPANPSAGLLRGGGVEMLSKVAATVAWKYTKAIYAFDPELTQILVAQAHDDEVPVETLLHLPVPCVYIAYPPMVKNCVGLYAFWEYDYRYQIPELRLHYLMQDDSMMQVYLQFAKPASTLHDAFDLAFRQAKVSEHLPEAVVAYALSPQKEYWQLDTPKTTLYDTLWAHINMILYLCSDEPDVSAPTEPRKTVTRNGVTTPKHPANYQVGTRIGAAIRRTREAAEREYAASTSAGHASPRPHVRRAHWHSFWTGKQGERKLIVKWMLPVFVAVGKEFKIDTTIYPVKP